MSDKKGKLYIVGTPIGNLGDFSPRAAEVLGAVDFIAAEDTRVTLKLLNHFGIKKPLVSYFEHNKRTHGEIIIERLFRGETAAIVTDAGMPAISDPGEDLIRAAAQAGIEIESVPGPTAFATALALSALPTGRFCFEGFLPTDKKELKARLAELCEEPRTMIFYEAPHRLVKTLDVLLNALGDRNAAIAKELTKIHETVLRTTLKAATEYYAQNPPKGEFVIVVEGARKQEKHYTPAEAAKIAKMNMESGMSASAAAAAAAKETGIKKSEIYPLLVKN